MKSASVSELKNRLSHYLRYVRRGQSVVVYDRDRAIARIEPVRGPIGADSADWIAEQVQAGILRPPEARLPANWLEGRPHAKPDIVAALLDERETGR